MRAQSRSGQMRRYRRLEHRSEPEGFIKGSYPSHAGESARADQRKSAVSGAFAEPSDGLEPSTPPYHGFRPALVATHGNDFRFSEPLGARADLPPVATGCNHGAPQGLHTVLSPLATAQRQTCATTATGLFDQGKDRAAGERKAHSATRNLPSALVVVRVRVTPSAGRSALASPTVRRKRWLGYGSGCAKNIRRPNCA